MRLLCKITLVFVWHECARNWKKLRLTLVIIDFTIRHCFMLIISVLKYSLKLLVYRFPSRLLSTEATESIFLYKVLHIKKIN